VPSQDGAKKSARDVDAFLAAVPEEARDTLEKLRKTIQAAAPKATEGIGYGIPTFYHQGPLVGYGASKNHCGLYVMSPAVMDAHREQLKQYDTATATIRFPANKPLPAALVTKLVMARIAENEARKGGYGGKTGRG
jgi:uncharacterized protein YdhG (YjbR/CyaY superfamily)